MNLSRSVERLRERLRELARVHAGDDGATLIDQLGPSVEPALTLVLLEAMTSAVKDMPGDTRITSIEVSAQGVELTLTPGSWSDNDADTLAASAVQAWDADETARTTLRLPAGLRDAIIARAERDGTSANSWMLRVLALGVAPHPLRKTRPQQSLAARDGARPSGMPPTLDEPEEREPDLAQEWPSGWVRATLGMVALRTLEAGPSYGYAIFDELAVAGLGQVKEGTLYQLLTRLEESELVAVEWRHSTDGPARKYLTLTTAGRAALEQQRQDWELFTRAIGRYLDGSRS